MVKWLNGLIKLFLFLLPWQTILIYREVFVGGVKSEYTTLGFYATEVLLWLIVVLFMGWYWRKIRSKIKDQKFKITKDRVFVFSCLLFIVYCLLSIIWASDKSLALQQSTRILEVYLLFFVIFTGPLDFKTTVKWLALGAVLPSVLGIWQFLTQSTFSSTLLGLSSHPVWQAGSSIIQSDTIGRWLRAYGTFSHPNVFGGYLVVVIILLLSLRADPPVGGETWQSLTSLGLLPARHASLQGVASRRQSMQIGFLAMTALFSISLFFTFSRSAWLVLAIGLLSFLLYHRITKSPQRLLLVILPFIIFSVFSGIYFPLIQTRTSESAISENRSVEERISGYQDAWQIIKTNLVLGVGVGNYPVALWRLDKWRPVWEIQPVHNVPLLFVAELGLVGVFLFLLLVASFVNLVISEQIAKNKILFFILCSLFFIPLSMFDHYLYSSYVGLALTAVYFSLITKISQKSLHS